MSTRSSWAGHGDMHRYYVIGKGDHVDSFYDDNKERLRPILPCHRDAFVALEDFVERDVAPPQSGYVPKPERGDVVNRCSIEEKTSRPEPGDPGSGSARTITGTKGTDELCGTRRDDVICGLGDGNDRLNARDGASGNDALIGGAGKDICAADRGDTVDRCP